MKIEAAYPRPPQHETAITRANERCPESAAEIDTILTFADEQAYTNLSIYEPPEFPKVKIPVTKFSFALTPKGEDTLPEPKSTFEVNLGGFEVAQNGLNQENYYNRIFAYADEVQQTGNPIEHTVFFVGQSTSLGGRTTKQFFEAKRHHGLSIEGGVIASFAEETIPQSRDNMNVIFYGKSMGAIKALEAARQSAHTRKSAELLNPPRIPGLSKEYQPSDLHIVLGYILQSSFDKGMREVMKEVVRKEYSQELQDIFEAKGISTKDSVKQNLLKTGVVLLNIPNILSNTVHKQEDFDFPVHAQVGALDPINFSRRGLSHVISEERITKGNIIIDYVMDHHSPNPYPVHKWSKSLQGVDIKPL